MTTYTKGLGLFGRDLTCLAMCHYITGLLSPGADSAAVRQLAKRHFLDWEPLEKHALQSALRKGETYYITTRSGSCDCGTSLGLLQQEDGLPGLDYERQKKKLRKKGWSNQKIDRWIDDKQRDARKASERNSHCLNNPPQDVLHWLDFVSQVLDASAATYLGLLVHWYDGPIESERLEVVKRRSVTREVLDHKYLLRAEDDVIHVFRAE